MTFTYTPDFPVEERSQPRIREATAGAYSQRAPDGIQLLRDTWPLTFSARTDADRDAILSYFETREGAESFEWVTPFGETGQFVCLEWDTTLDSCGLSTVTATFALTYVPGQTNIADATAPSAAFSYIPNFSSQQTYKSDAKVITFGDGYAHRLRYGLHPQKETWSLVFTNRTNTERNNIRTYLRGAARISSFDWQDPYGTTAKYVCRDWTVRYSRFNDNSISAEFERVYEP